MFKFVVLCAIVAVVTAEPGVVLSPASFAQYSAVISPATTTISKQDSSVIHTSSNEYYSAPLPYIHVVKKRSPGGYFAPSTYIASTPYIAPTTYIARTQLIQSAPIVPAVTAISPAVHLIKKRSAALVPTTYIAPHAYSVASYPLLTTYASTPLVSSTKLISQPIIYNHLIKKRSAPLLNTYVAPTVYSTQSKIDLSSAPLSTISYSTPITYSSPLTYQHLY